MIIDCLSDLHGNLPQLEGGDVLIVAGDLTKSDDAFEHSIFRDWIVKQNYQCKIFIAGNHDGYIVKDQHKIYTNFQSENQDTFYLCEDGIEIDGIKFWGVPWTQWFKEVNPRAAAFMIKDEELLRCLFEKIPPDIDVLISHCPPYGILDKVGDAHLGSKALYQAIVEREQIKLHVFGHIHEGYGQFEEMGILFVNASLVDKQYNPVNKPIRVIL